MSNPFRKSAMTRPRGMPCLPAIVAVSLAAAVATAADRWWDGPNAGATGNRASDGGGGTWDVTNLNWDQGDGLPRVAWNDTNLDAAIFGGTGGAVSVASPVVTESIALEYAGGTFILSGSAITLAGGSPRISVTRNATLNAPLAGNAGFAKTGAATLTLGGAVTHGITGGLRILGGGITLNFSALATPTNLLDPGNTVTLGAGTLSVSAKSSDMTTQSLNGLALAGGQAVVAFTSTASASNSLNLGTITRDHQAALNFILPASGSITTTLATNPAGVLGGWATTGAGINLRYASASGGVVTAAPGTDAPDPSALTDTTGLANYNLTASGIALPDGLACNTLRHAAAAGTSSLAGACSVNGLLNAGSGVWTLGTGPLTIGAERELVVNAVVQGMAIQSTIVDHPSGASGLTLVAPNASGETSPVVLAATNGYTGGTTINGSGTLGDSLKTVIISALRAAGVASEFGAGSSLTLNGAVVRTGATATSDRAITLNGNSGFYVKGNITQTLAGAISGSGNLSVDGDYTGGAAGGSGNLILAGDNSFTGEVLFQNDSRITLAHPRALANATLNLSGTRILANFTTHNLAYVIGGLRGSVDLNLGTAKGAGGDGLVSVGGNHRSTTYTGVLSGAAGLRKTGDGTLTLAPATPHTYGGGTVVEAGVLAVNGRALPDTGRLTILGGKVSPVGEELVDTLYFGAVRQAAGTWGASGSGAEHVDDVRFLGTGGVIRVQPWAVDPEALAFGEVAVGATSTLQVTITNLGNSPLNGTAATDGAPFGVVSGSWSVAASATTTVEVTFAPAALQPAAGTLTLTGAGLTRTITLGGLGVAVAMPVADSFRDYACDIVPAMPAPAAAAQLTLTEGGWVTQSFIPRRDDFLSAYAARDAATPAGCRLSVVSIRTTAYQNSPSTLRFEVFRVEPGGARTLLGSEDFQQQLFGNTTYSFTFGTPPLLAFDANHELRLTLVTAGNSAYGGGSNISLFRTGADYPDGDPDVGGGDLWCGLTGLSALPVYAGFSAAGAADNRFFLDASPENADSSSVEALPGKLLGANAGPERLVFAHPASWGPLAFEIDPPGAAAGAVISRTGTTDTLELSSPAEGRGMLWVRAGGTVVGWMKLQTYERRSVALSYTYVQYPGESDHALKTMSGDIMAYISSVYARANVAIDWVDNGVITHEWDLNGDGNSHADDYSEMWSPMDSGAIPNQSSVFANAFMLRYDKDDGTARSGGGGTSRGFGPAAPPAVAAGYGAMVRCTLNRSAQSLGSTLAHEVGHNLGLWHTNITNNLMDVGRAQDNLWTWQWDIIHDTLKSLATVPPPVMIATDPLPPGGMVGESYTHTFTVSGGTAGFTWTLASGSLPPGLDLTGPTLAGTPSAEGTYAFTLRVTDSAAATTTASFDISVIHPDANGNGIIDIWEIEKFGSAGPGEHPADGDLDGDGMVELLEFALDTDPLAPGVSPLIQGLVAFEGAEYLQLEVRKNPLATNLRYVVETSGDLVTWSADDTVVRRDDAAMLVARDAVAVGEAHRRFIRLRVRVAE